VLQPPVVPRPAWDADESLRFDADGNEITPPSFYRVQKLIVHHTASRNGDPDPAETLRTIQRFHVAERGFGDIAYNLLIDEEGAVYEGRYSPFAAAGEAPPAHDPDGDVVAATHTLGYNAGTISVALLGHFVETDPTDAAIEALTGTLAWLAGAHDLDPVGRGVYINPVSGREADCPNVLGHGEIMSTLCPGARLTDRLPDIRERASSLIG
jgi:hypothetical protein